MLTELSKNEKIILEFLRKRESSTNKGLAKSLGLDENSINQSLNLLRTGGYVLFKQEFHVSAGELIMAKITARGLNAAEDLLKARSVPKSIPINAALATDQPIAISVMENDLERYLAQIESREGLGEYEREMLKSTITDLEKALKLKELRRVESISKFIGKVAPWLDPKPDSNLLVK